MPLAPSITRATALVRPSLLLASPDSASAQALARLLALGCYGVSVVQLDELSPAHIDAEHPDAMLLLQIGRDGLVHCAELLAHASARGLPVLLVDDEMASDPACWRGAGAADCVPLGCSSRELEARIEHVLRPRRLQQATLDAGIDALLQMMATHHLPTALHMRRVASLALELGRRLGLSEPSLRGLERAALLHDIGKVAVSPEVLQKRGHLSAAEQQRLRQHPLIGEQIVAMLPNSKAIAWVVRFHHEAWAGTGYPDGLRGEEIPLGARIVAVADGFDALSSPRPYQTVLSIPATLELMQNDAGRQWDPAVVAALVELMAEQLAPLERSVGYGQAA